MTRTAAIAYLSVLILIPLLVAYALLRLRGRWWPRIASVLGAFASTFVIVIGSTGLGLGRPWPEYGSFILLMAAILGVLNVGFALFLPRPD